jgi:hypothetical protein
MRTKNRVEYSTMNHIIVIVQASLDLSKIEHPALRKKSKDWLARNQDNVSGWSNMSIRGLLPQTASTINIKLSRPHHRIMRTTNRVEYSTMNHIIVIVQASLYLSKIE